MKTTFLSEVSQFLLTKETVTDSWRILKHVTLGHRRCRAQLKFWFGQNCIDMISHRIFPRTTQGYKGDLNAKVNQKAPGKMRCKFIMETIEFFKSKTKKKRDRKSIPKPRKHTMKQYDLLARQSVVYWKILASFLLTAMKAITRTTPRGGNLP